MIHLRTEPVKHNLLGHFRWGGAQEVSTVLYLPLFLRLLPLVSSLFIFASRRETRCSINWCIYGLALRMSMPGGIIFSREISGITNAAKSRSGV